MALLWLFFLNTLCSFSITSAELINSLPGQPSEVTFKQDSGYIVTDDYHGRALFYYFVEAQSENPLSRPLTLWLGGANGCSTIGFGPFMEHGPFRLEKDGNLIKNEFSWNLESNMLYIESPIGIGFSYSNTSSDYAIWNDALTAIDNMKFLLKWFEKFPQYRNQNLYLAGDSYGGHFVPQLAALVLEYNRIPHAKPIKLKGIALGNPNLDIMISYDSDDFLLYHGIISEELRAMQKKLCNTSTYNLEMALGKPSKVCIEIEDKLEVEVGDDVEMDSLLFPICKYTDDSVGHHLSGRDIIEPCPSLMMAHYLNKPEVQKALHANTTGLPYPWSECRGALDKLKDDGVINIIPTVLALLKRHIPVLLYSGDQDLLIPITQTRKIANMLARDLKLKTLQKYAPWYNGIQVGGWSQVFGKLKKGKKVTYLTFATVRGGSHFVPHSSPSEALTLFKAFLKGSPPPRTNTTLTS